MASLVAPHILNLSHSSAEKKNIPNDIAIISNLRGRLSSLNAMAKIHSIRTGRRLRAIIHTGVFGFSGMF